MNIVFFSTKQYEKDVFYEKNQFFNHKITFLETRLTESSVKLAEGYEGICVFVNDVVNASVLISLKKFGIKLVALRCAGFNNVDLEAANNLGIMVVRVPEYSPYSVAEHTMGLILTLNRKFHRAFNRVREGNFSLDGLLGFDLFGKTLGIIGTGKIGISFAKIASGFGFNLIAYDKFQNIESESIGIKYVEINEIFSNSDIISLHCPLTPETKHIINNESIAKMKKGVMIINTSRGALVDTADVISGLKSGKIGYLGLDVYEEEADLFFEDLSDQIIQDDAFTRLLAFPNVIITGHQAFFTSNALENITIATLENIKEFEDKGTSINIVGTEKLRK